ncbi:MAG: phosphatase PAP2 family protein [Bacteroidota bacterium]
MDIVKDRLLPFFLILLLCIPLLFIEKTQFIFFVNSLRTPFWDLFFIKSSALGNAVTVIFAMLLVLRFKFKWLAIFLIAFAIQVVIVVLFKKGIYHGELRPYLYFKRSHLLPLINLVEGVKMRHVNTFPSGHTATIFFLVSFFALLARNKVATWVLLLVGLVVGFSRIYLVQHWYADVYFGMLFGIASSVMGYLLVKRYPKVWHKKRITINIQEILQNTQNAFRHLF